MGELTPAQVGVFMTYWVAAGIAAGVFFNVCGVVWLSWRRYVEAAGDVATSG